MTSTGAPSTALIMQGRPFDRARALDAGLRRDDVTWLLAAGEVRQPFRGVYLDARVPDDLATRAACVRLRLPEEAAVCRMTGAWLAGVDGLTLDQRAAPPLVECVVPRGTQPLRWAGVRCYSAPLAPADIVEVGGVPTTVPRRIAADVLRWSPPHIGLWVCDALAARGLISREEVLAALGEFAGHRGVARARYLADLIEPGSESFGETCLRLRLADAGFPRPVVQIEIVDADGRVVFRLDLGWEDRRIAIEYDGEEFHSTPAQVAHDSWRRELVEKTYDWQVLAVGRGEVFGPSLALERGIGELLSLTPQILRRRW